MPRGSVVVLAGPDGAGKSSLATQLEIDNAGERSVVRLHHRPRVLPSRAASRQATEEPHAGQPYPRWICVVKVAYLALDFSLGWSTRVRPATRRGDLVVLERGWWDIVVDPRRYRLTGVDGLTKAMARILPRPQLTVILTADPNVLFDRKPELPVEEIGRQQAAWLAISKAVRDTLVVDATRPVASLSAEVATRLSPDPPAVKGRSRRLVRLSARGSTTWLIPSEHRALARSGLSIYQPMSLTSRLGWEAARMLAAAGAFRFLPSSDAAAATWGYVAPYIPRGGTAAIAQGRRDDRFVALIVDRSGSPVSLAKVALDATGRASLGRELDALSRLGGLVPPPLLPPRVYQADDGIVLFEPVEWVPRRRPWDLPKEVAAALGRFHAHRVDNGSGAGHPVHGDFTPWNILLREDGNWVLVDWEEARLDASSFDDIFHFVLQANGHLGSPSTHAIVKAVEGRGRLGAALEAFADEAGIPRASIKAALEGFIVRSIPRLHMPSPAGRRSIRARRQILRALQDGKTPDVRSRFDDG